MSSHVPVIHGIAAPATARIEARRPQYDPVRKEEVKRRIRQRLKDVDGVLVAHYYVDRDVQELAEETGGHVADSLEMARFGAEHPARCLVVAGVRFMGETAKILNPDKRVVMPTLKAECSLDLACPASAFIPFCDQHPDHTVVVYANTSATVKARADYVVTSGIAADLLAWLAEQGRKVLWAPDRHLGRYVQRLTGADMVLWQGSCVVHDEFRGRALAALKAQYPEAGVLVHPESPADVIRLADAVGSTSQLIKAAQTMPRQRFIVATDRGIFYKMQQAAPGKEFIAAPAMGEGATCRSCAHCPWMAMNGLHNLLHVLETGANEIVLDEAIRVQALRATRRMLEFAATLRRT